jgi:hypothetical protein
MPAPPPASHRLAYFSLTIGLFSIGISAILVRAADAPGSISAFYRMFIGALFMALPFLGSVKRAPVNPLPRTGVRLALLGGLLFAFDLVFWATGITISGAATPTLMANTAPIWVGLGAMLLFHERLTLLFWGGLVVSFVGALLVLSADFNRGSAAARLQPGNLCRISGSGTHRPNPGLADHQLRPRLPARFHRGPHPPRPARRHRHLRRPTPRRDLHALAHPRGVLTPVRRLHRPPGAGAGGCSCSLTPVRRTSTARCIPRLSIRGGVLTFYGILARAEG